MKRSIIRIAVALVALLVVAALVFFAVVPAYVDSDMNVVREGQGFTPSDDARAFHNTLFIADLHCDLLLWNRDLLVGNTRGHVDLPRLIQGNVALQAFTVVTKTPRNMNYDNNTGDTDNITLLAIAQRWPVNTWSSLLQRALYQANKLHDAADRSNGAFRVIESRKGLETLLKDRETNPHLVGGFLGVEGLQCLEGNLENVDVLYDAGFRMMGPTHFFDNEVGGSAHGVSKAGLTEFGKQVIRRMEERQILVDLAHASPNLIDDVLAMATRPVLSSHTGVKGTCDRIRNLSDAQLRGIARTGGLVGIGYWEEAVCGTDASAIVDAIGHTVDVVGVDHVALGSDFDGATTTPFDTTGIVAITDELMKRGFSEQDIALIMGGNVRRLLMQVLPPA